MTLVEVMAATSIASVIALAVAQQAILAHQLRRTGAYWMTATQLATEQMERLRAGDRSQNDDPVGRFERSWGIKPAFGYPDLDQAEVTVVWEDRGEQCFTLTALIPG